MEIKGDKNSPGTEGRICAKGKSGIMGLYNPNRVTVPLMRTNPEKGLGVDPGWKEMSWDQALKIIEERLRKIRKEDPRKLLLCEMDYPVIPQVLAWASAFGTINAGLGSSGFFCGNGLHPIMYLTHGSFYSEPDLDYCNYLLLVGSQTGFMTHINAVASAKRMADARERGMKVVVVDPVCNNAASKADEWVPIRPGTDAAFALGLINILLNDLRIFDAWFIKNYTNGPYLVGPDGLFIRDEARKKPLIWDPVDGRAKPYDDPSIAAVAAIIGGVGHLLGAGVAAFLLGLLQNWSVLKLFPQWQEAVAFGLFIIFLIFLPRGLFGSKVALRRS